VEDWFIQPHLLTGYMAYMMSIVVEDRVMAFIGWSFNDIMSDL